MINKIQSQLFILIAIVLTSCSSSLTLQRGEYLKAYHHGGLCQAEKQLDHMLPSRNYTRSSDAAWVLLDRATTRFAMGKMDDAIADYCASLEALDYYSQDLPVEQLNKILLQDQTGAYQADDFEQVLARLYLSLALLHQGDTSNAFAILRQAEEYQQKKRIYYSQSLLTRDYQLIDNPLSKYLFAVLLEKYGDFSNANILYKESGIREPGAGSRKPGQATVLIVCHNGKAPYKISGISDASIASALALEMLLGSSHRDPAISSLTGIPVPKLCYWPYSSGSLIRACLDGGQYQCLHPIYDIGYAAEHQLSQKMPVIVARGAARLALRRTTVGYMQEQDPALGFLTDMVMLAANANTKADTRSWTTLPLTIDMARFDLSPGKHTLSISVEGASNQSFPLSLQSDDLCVINIFNLHPGITKILIPQHFFE